MKPIFATLLLVAACGEVQQVQPDGTPPDADPCAAPNVCECTAATQNADCGAHEVCNESAAGRVCECAPAYREQGGACVFAGAPLDPGFGSTATWMPSGLGAAIDITAAGNLDPGEGVINRVGMCNSTILRQQFEMPPFDRAEPLKLAVTHTSADPDFNFFQSTLLSFGVGKQFFDVPNQRNGFRTDVTCLGPAAFGGNVDFVVGTFGGIPCSAMSGGTIRIDQFAVQVANPGECPMPGTVLNNDFEAATDWTFPVLQSATAGINATAGENGTAGVLMTLPNQCSEARAVGSIGLPAAGTIPNPAIDVFWNGTSGRRLLVALDNKAIGTLNANGVAKHSRICVPAWALGTSARLEFLAQRQQNNTCTALNPARTFNIDNISIVNEPACPAASDITDPGFERVANATGPMPGWGLLNGHVNEFEGGAVIVINNPNTAHSGNGVLRTACSNQCISAQDTGADLTLIVPPAQGTAGPAVKFFARADVANANTETVATLLPADFQNEPIQVVVPETGAFVQNILCLPPALIGRRATVRFSTSDPDGGGCTVATTTEFGFFDDIEITTDPSCAAQ